MSLKIRLRRYCHLIWAAVIPFGVLAPQSAPALDGASALRINTFSGWKVFELVTQNNEISVFDDLGYSVGGTVNRGTLDHLGIYVSGNSMSIILNRETSAAAIRGVEVDAWLRGYPGVAGFLPTPKNAS